MDNKENKKRYEFNCMLSKTTQNANEFLELTDLLSNLEINYDNLEVKGIDENFINWSREFFPNGIKLNLGEIVWFIKTLVEHKGLIPCSENEYQHTRLDKNCYVCENQYFIPLERYLELQHKWSIPPF